MDFTERVDLAAERLGGAALLANDEFFAPKENLIRAGKPVWREGEYTERGKWMDGWETRRRRSPGHDWCILRLGLPGVIHGVVVDTSFFTGNYPESCSLEACAVAGVPEPAWLAGEEAAWVELLPRSPLRGDAVNGFAIAPTERFTHVRLNIFPDGGVARLRVHGDVVPDPASLRRPEIDLAAVENGGWVALCSDMHYGNRQNLILPGPPLGMHDGWETKRRRGPGHDWAVVRLGARGRIRRVVVDTSHFKGNAPGSCSLEALDSADATPAELTGSAGWRGLLPETKLQPHTVHPFEAELERVPAATHVRLNVFPDGGVARLRLFGEVVR
ncbi:MAG TPA: allantoicase [Longimicrobiales bacterium]|nr:allantoicase [Longimicrobiales bacterium]